MKKCELCKKAARIYCHSDQASLCWDCDYRVHTANFIVSKHTRTLLCHSCQGPTPWTGSGSNFGPTVSVCDTCANGRNTDPRNGNAHDDDDVDDDDHTHDDDDDDDDDDDGENQVVPLSLEPSSSSTEGYSSSGFSRSSLGSSKATTSTESLSFSSYDEKKAVEKKGGLRSWKWR